MTNLKGKLAVITGASSGIGRSIAFAWMARGGDAWLLGRKIEHLESLAAETETTSKITRCLQVDLDDEHALRDASWRIREESRQIDLLVHSAGRIGYGSVADCPIDDFDLQYRLNLRAPYLLTQLLLPAVVAGPGQVVFVNSSAGLNAVSHFSQYAATKHALKALADSLRSEVNQSGVRVLSVYPGRTSSPMQEDLCRMEGQPYQPEKLLQPDDVASSVLHAICLPDTAELTDLSIRPLRK